MPLSVSNNQLSTVAKCSLAAVLRYGHNRQSMAEGPYQKAGHVWHTGMEILWRGGTKKEVLTAMAKEYKEWAEANIDPDDKHTGRLAWDNVQKLMSYYIDQYPVETLPFVVNPKRLEIKFDDLPLTKKGDIVFMGIIDGGPFKDKRTGRYYGVDHKAQPLWSRVLMLDGWGLMQNVRVNDHVIGSDGKPTKVLEIYPQGKLQNFRVTMTDGSIVHCSFDHLWTVQTRTGKWETKTLKEIAEAPDYARFRLPICQPIEYDTIRRPLPLAPYVLGALLGDGYLAGHSIALSAAEEELVQLVEDELPDDTYIHKSKGENYTWSIVARDRTLGRNSVLQAIKTLGLFGSKSETKFVPPIYLLGSIEDRLALLQGLLDTDGCIHKGHIFFDSVSLQLIHDVVELTRSLGGTAHYRERTGTKQRAYRATLCFSPEIVPFRLQRKVAKLVDREPTNRIASIEYAGIEEMQCIRVEAGDGLYITDDFVVTHNTTGQINSPWFLPKFRLDSQMTGYLWAMRELVPEKVVAMYVNAFQLAQLPGRNNPERKCRDHKLPYSECQPLHMVAQLIVVERTPDAVKQWRWDAIDLAHRFITLMEEYPELEDIERVPQEGKFNGGCGFCDFSDFCYAGRPADRLDAMTAPRQARAELKV